MNSNEWLDMISTHVQWKLRLQAYIKGESTEHFDVKKVASDSNCVLGAWIYNNAKKFSQTAAFETVRLGHAELHLKAAEIITLSNRGFFTEAEHMIEGEFSEISNQFKRDIIKLSRFAS